MINNVGTTYSPLPALPSSFSPGRHYFQFRVPFAQTLVWNLNGSILSVNQYSVQCPDIVSLKFAIFFDFPPSFSTLDLFGRNMADALRIWRTRVSVTLTGLHAVGKKRFSETTSDIQGSGGTLLVTVQDSSVTTGVSSSF